MEEDAPTIPVRMNKRITEKSLKNMNGDFLLGLRDMRRSENAHYARSHNQAANDTERKMVNMLFKEQRWQLAKIKRGQVQFYNRLVKVHRHKRKCQREEYKRRQEEIRQDMQNIRLRRLIKRVVEKFRQNVKRKKAERARKRFAIAGGLRNASGLGGAAKHGVAGVQNQASDSITRMIKLAAKRESLEKEGVLPRQALGGDSKRSLEPKTKHTSEGRGLASKEAKTGPTNPISVTHSKTDTASVPKTANVVTSADKQSPKVATAAETVPEKQHDRVVAKTETTKRVSKLTEENMAVHDQLTRSDIKEHTGISERFPNRARVVEVSKGDVPISKTLIAAADGGEPQYMVDSGGSAQEGPVAPIGEEPQRKELGHLKIPRRATLKPPPSSFLLKIDEVDLMEKANADSEDRTLIGNRHHDKDEPHRKSEQPSIRLSQLIRWERRAAERKRLEALNEELIPHYKRAQDGNLRVQMVPFVRTSFKPPSNKIRYEQDKMKKEEKLNMARQRVRIRNFVHHCPVADPEADKFYSPRKKETVSQSVDSASYKPQSLTTLMFSVYHQEMPPEGVDPNSVDALKKCRYIRYYDISKNKRNKDQMSRRQGSSWDSPTLSEQERRRQMLLHRQRAAVYR